MYSTCALRSHGKSSTTKAKVLEGDDGARFVDLELGDYGARFADLELGDDGARFADLELDLCCCLMSRSISRRSRSAT